MTRYQYDDQVQALKAQGLGYSEIGRRLNLSRWTVRDICLRLANGGGIYLTKLKIITSLRQQCKTYQEISDETGLTKKQVEEFCRREGLGYSEEELIKARQRSFESRGESWNKGKVVADWEQKTKIKFNGTFELVKVGEIYDSGERYITVRCKKCGTEKTLSSNSFKGECGKRGFCEVCEIKTRQVQKQLEKQAEQLEKEKKQTKKKLKAKQIKINFCECGNIIPTHKRFCLECAEKRKSEQLKVQWHLSDVKRRSRLQKVKHDNDLTLEKLYERDNGVCHLCGGLCDWNDYHITNGQKQADNYYPSIDHLITVSNGGTHTWDNVKLAHRICNSKRGAKPIAPSSEIAS